MEITRSDDRSSSDNAGGDRVDGQQVLPLCFDTAAAVGSPSTTDPSATAAPPIKTTELTAILSPVTSTSSASSLTTDCDEVRVSGAPEVEIRTSTRRRKTATAYWEGDHIVVVLPAHVRGRQRTELIEWLVKRARSRRPGANASDEELAGRAAMLADRYLGGIRPSSIRWVTNQSKRWGSCSSHSEEIRISHRLQVVPDWVLDAILVHELAHLIHPDHSQSFYQMANRYPRQEEASTYLDGFALGLDQS